MTTNEKRTTLRELMEFLKQFPEDSIVECCMQNGDVEYADVHPDPDFPPGSAVYGSTKNINITDLRHNPWIKKPEDKKFWIKFGCRS